MDDNHLERWALHETQRFIDLAETHFGTHITQPQVSFDLRGRAAGMVVFAERGTVHIRYNRPILQENGEAFIRQTVPHEVAHLVARTLHGARIKPHGREWQSIMRLFGANANRCHNFSTKNIPLRRMRYFPYRCNCKYHQLSTIRHNRCKAGVTYLCRACGTALVSVRTKG